MLHAVLFILKLAGWILLAVLGVLLLLFCAVLFTPLRYQVESGWRGELSTWEAGVKFQLFFRLVSGRVRYRKGELVWSARVAWKKFGSRAEPEEVAEKAVKQIEITEEEAEEEISRAETAEEEARQAGAEEREEEARQAETEEREEEARQGEAAKEEPQRAEAVKEEPRQAETAEEAETAQEPEEWPEHEENLSQEEQKQPAESQQEEKAEEGKGVPGKIEAFFKKIKYTFTQICDKIETLLKKKEVLTAFLTDEVHQRAFGKAVHELKKLLKRMKPKKIFGELRFGFADPSYTGRVLAVVRMLSAIWEDPIVVYPDFEQKILDGKLAVKGTIRAFPIAALAWNMLWNRDVRRTIRDIRKFRFV